jgi:transposase-like protein
LSDGRKVVLAIEAGHRESSTAWSSLLRSLRERGLRLPRLVIADGHLGIWAALTDVFPEVAQQRCWNHKLRNVLDRLPRRLRESAKRLLQELVYAETREKAETLRDDFVERFGAEHPQAAETLIRDWDRMVTFYDFPREHWKHLRTTNPVESPFAAVRLRTDAGKRYKKVANATALIWRLLMVAERHFRRLDHPELLPLVAAGVRFQDGERVLDQHINHDQRAVA